jgi:pilus assembly protein CpaE
MDPARAVLIADDDLERREQVRRLVERTGAGTAHLTGQGVAISDRVRETAPSLVLVSVEEPPARAVQTIEFVAASFPEIAVVAYSTTPTVQTFQKVVRAGATHLLQWPLAEGELRAALSRVQRKPTGADEASTRPGGRVLTVIGQKGGVGKTTISINLAATLARETKGSVLVIDFDTAFGDVGLSLDLHGAYTAARAARDLGVVDVEGFKSTLAEHYSGAHVLAAPAGVKEWVSVTPGELEALVSFVRDLFDYVIVDTPGTYNEAVAAAVSVADHLLIITSMEVSSAKNTGLLLQVLHDEGFPDDRTLVIANNTSPVASLQASDLGAALGRDSVWEVPFDKDVRKASQLGRPIVLLKPKSRASRSLHALASRVASDPGRLDRRAVVRANGKIDSRPLRARLEAALSRASARAAS